MGGDHELDLDSYEDCGSRKYKRQKCCYVKARTLQQSSRGWILEGVSTAFGPSFQQSHRHDHVEMLQARHCPDSIFYTWKGKCHGGAL